MLQFNITDSPAGSLLPAQTSHLSETYHSFANILFTAKSPDTSILPAL